MQFGRERHSAFEVRSRAIKERAKAHEVRENVERLRLSTELHGERLFERRRNNEQLPEPYQRAPGEKSGFRRAVESILLLIAWGVGAIVSTALIIGGGWGLIGLPTMWPDFLNGPAIFAGAIGWLFLIIAPDVLD